MKPLALILSAFILTSTLAGTLCLADPARDWSEKGLFFKRAGQHDRAIEAFSKAIEMDPDNAGLYNNRGAVLYMKKAFDPAIADYTKALSLDPGSLPYYINRAAAWFKKGAFENTLADYTRALEIDPGFADAYNNRGMVRYYQGDFDLAIADHTKAISLNPEAPDYYNNLGAAWFRKERYERAIAAYSRALSLSPDNFTALKNRGIAWFRQGIYPRAVTDYTKALNLRPKSAEVLVSRGILFYESRKYSKAVLDFLDAVSAEPDNPDALNQLAWMLAVCPDATYRNGAKAVEMAQNALKVYPTLNTLDTLATALAEAGNFQEACARQKEIIALAREKSSQIPSQYLAKLESYQNGNPWRADSIFKVPRQHLYPLKRTINVPAGNIRSEPDTASHVIEKEPRGATLTLLGRDGPWYLTDLGNGLFGWAHEMILSPAPAGAASGKPAPMPVKADRIGTLPVMRPIAETLEVIVNTGRIRALPTTKSPVIATVQKGEQPALLEEEGEWYRVLAGRGKAGWAHKSLFKSGR